MADTHPVKITVIGDCGHVVFEGLDLIEEKYPFWCEVCERYCRDGRYPWKLTTEVMP